MSGAKWVCFCGSTEFEKLGYSIRPRGIYAKCIKCQRVLRITKHGMATLNSKKFPFIVKGSI